MSSDSSIRSISTLAGSSRAISFYIAVLVAVTLSVVTIFTAIFVNEIILRKEEQRREGMASVSHELRTPLAALQSQIEAMQDGIRPLNQEQLQITARPVGQFSHLVDDLYQLALADKGVQVCRQEPLDLSELMTHTTEACREKLARRNITLETDVQPDLLVEGDE